MEKLEFKILTVSDIQKIEDIRVEEYRRYYGENVDVTGLKWNRADGHSVHLGYLDGGNLVSYLRLSFFSSLDKLEKTTLFRTPSNIPLPVGLLARAATRHAYAGQGLHSILRCRALEFCMQHGIDCVLGTLEKRSPRLQQLTEVGYNIISTQGSWSGGYLKSQGDVVLICLRGSTQIGLAIEKLKRKFGLGPLSENLKTIHLL